MTSDKNQSPVHAGYNAFTGDGVLQTLANGLPDSVISGLQAHGKWVGSPEAQDLARLANENPPKLRTVSAKGDRLDVVDFHPAYHALMRRAVTQGLHASIWESGDGDQRNFVRALRFMLTSELESGHTCPITMTNASVAVFMMQPDLLEQWFPRITTRQYDASQKPPQDKAGVTIGMGMTERQGGTDVRTNTTRAERLPEGANAGQWRVNGEKWFLSAPMCDAFFVLSQTGKGLSCFLIARLLPDGQNNGLRLQRLKDKLGNRSNASSEVVFDDALATLVGDEGQGVKTILEMVTLTRLDCAIAAAAQMRVALGEAVHHVRHRKVFGKVLIDQPIMVNVLADMALDVAAAQALTLRLARSFDAAPQDDMEAGYARLMTPVVKYWTCKICPALIYEAMECLGGNGYVEESILPRLYREAPLNAIWEGSGNVMCLDLLRALRKAPDRFDAVLESIATDLGDGAEETLDVLRIAAKLALEDEGSARMLTEQLALTAAAAEMRRSLPANLADAFIETRLGRPWRHTYGMLHGRSGSRQIIDYVCQ